MGGAVSTAGTDRRIAPRLEEDEHEPFKPPRGAAPPPTSGAQKAAGRENNPPPESKSNSSTTASSPQEVGALGATHAPASSPVKTSGSATSVAASPLRRAGGTKAASGSGPGVSLSPDEHTRVNVDRPNRTFVTNPEDYELEDGPHRTTRSPSRVQHDPQAESRQRFKKDRSMLSQTYSVLKNPELVGKEDDAYVKEKRKGYEDVENFLAGKAQRQMAKAAGGGGESTDNASEASSTSPSPQKRNNSSAKSNENAYSKERMLLEDAAKKKKMQEARKQFAEVAQEQRDSIKQQWLDQHWKQHAGYLDPEFEQMHHGPLVKLFTGKEQDETSSTADEVLSPTSDRGESPGNYRFGGVRDGGGGAETATGAGSPPVGNYKPGTANAKGKVAAGNKTVTAGAAQENKRRPLDPGTDSSDDEESDSANPTTMRQQGGTSALHPKAKVNLSAPPPIPSIPQTIGNREKSTVRNSRSTTVKVTAPPPPVSSLKTPLPVGSSFKTPASPKKGSVDSSVVPSKEDRTTAKRVSFDEANNEEFSPASHAKMKSPAARNSKGKMFFGGGGAGAEGLPGAPGGAPAAAANTKLFHDDPGKVPIAARKVLFAWMKRAQRSMRRNAQIHEMEKKIAAKQQADELYHAAETEHANGGKSKKKSDQIPHSYRPAKRRKMLRIDRYLDDMEELDRLAMEDPVKLIKAHLERVTYKLAHGEDPKFDLVGHSISAKKVMEDYEGNTLEGGEAKFGRKEKALKDKKRDSGGHPVIRSLDDPYFEMDSDEEFRLDRLEKKRKRMELKEKEGSKAGASADPTPNDDRDIPFEFRPTMNQRFDEHMMKMTEAKKRRREQHKQSAKQADYKWQLELEKEREKAMIARRNEEQMRENLKQEKDRLEKLLKRIEQGRETMRASGMRFGADWVRGSGSKDHLSGSMSMSSGTGSSKLISGMELSMSGTTGTTERTTGSSASPPLSSPAAGVGGGRAGAAAAAQPKPISTEIDSNVALALMGVKKAGVSPRTSSRSPRSGLVPAADASLLQSTRQPQRLGASHNVMLENDALNRSGMAIAAQASASFWEVMQYQKADAQLLARENQQRKHKEQQEMERKRQMEKEILKQQEEEEKKLEEERKLIRENIAKELKAMELRRKEFVAERMGGSSVAALSVLGGSALGSALGSARSGSQPQPVDAAAAGEQNIASEQLSLTASSQQITIEDKIDKMKTASMDHIRELEFTSPLVAKLQDLEQKSEALRRDAAKKAFDLFDDLGPDEFDQSQTGKSSYYNRSQAAGDAGNFDNTLCSSLPDVEGTLEGTTLTAIKRGRGAEEVDREDLRGNNEFPEDAGETTGIAVVADAEGAVLIDEEEEDDDDSVLDYDATTGTVIPSPRRLGFSPHVKSFEEVDAKIERLRASSASLSGSRGARGVTAGSGEAAAGESDPRMESKSSKETSSGLNASSASLKGPFSRAFAALGDDDDDGTTLGNSSLSVGTALAYEKGKLDMSMSKTTTSSQGGIFKLLGSDDHDEDADDEILRAIYAARAAAQEEEEEDVEYEQGKAPASTPSKNNDQSDAPNSGSNVSSAEKSKSLSPNKKSSPKKISAENLEALTRTKKFREEEQNFRRLFKEKYAVVNSNQNLVNTSQRITKKIDDLFSNAFGDEDE
eukprot:CAMPEP_0178984398 /NCGR_PEP_ID=MMETSP0795-20121207/1581_1 /TAXON_ID=88552 /ORGANISM="Amoebophrya sp., Strain Ameob2" /LENGTH=1641 /DNA_ID=CAMNT_0020675253 /DNA_START=298 /DNA_END=5224 /DNA_ORIENTATION=+